MATKRQPEHQDVEAKRERSSSNKRITVRELASLTTHRGKWMAERVNHGHGSLVFRALAGKALAIYYRYMDNGSRVLVDLGRYDPTGATGITLETARAKAGELSKLHSSGVTALREYLKAKSEEENDKLRRAENPTPMPESGTFGKLLECYVINLRNEGRSSAREAESIFARWVKAPHPNLIALPAREITGSQALAILTVPAQEGLTRTVNKLRSYLLAAFNQAIQAVRSPRLAATMGDDFKISVNPFSATIRESSFDKPRKRVLTSEELSSYLNSLESLPFIIRAALALALRLGGQRPSQLLRVSPKDIDLVAGTIKLFDPKGRRVHAREHLLPLPQATKPIILELLALNGSAPYLFSSDGRSMLSCGTLSHRVHELSVGRYQLRDIRRTCETIMASLEVSKDIRAQIQSHGLGGVQDRHYDFHDYLPQKLDALEKFNEALDGLVR